MSVTIGLPSIADKSVGILYQIFGKMIDQIVRGVKGTVFQNTKVDAINSYNVAQKTYANAQSHLSSLQNLLNSKASALGLNPSGSSPILKPLQDQITVAHQSVHSASKACMQACQVANNSKAGIMCSSKCGSTYASSFHSVAHNVATGVSQTTSPVSNDAAHLIPHFLGYFNMALLSCFVIILCVVIFMSVLNSAHEGKFLASNSRFIHFWLILRIMVGGILMIPLKTGYCTIQYLLMYVILIGVSMATFVWHHSIDDIAYKNISPTVPGYYKSLVKEDINNAFVYLSVAKILKQEGLTDGLSGFFGDKYAKATVIGDNKNVKSAVIDKMNLACSQVAEKVNTMLTSSLGMYAGVASYLAANHPDCIAKITSPGYVERACNSAIQDQVITKGQNYMLAPVDHDDCGNGIMMSMVVNVDGLTPNQYPDNASFALDVEDCADGYCSMDTSHPEKTILNNRSLLKKVTIFSKNAITYDFQPNVDTNNMSTEAQDLLNKLDSMVNNVVVGGQGCSFDASTGKNSCSFNDIANNVFHDIVDNWQQSSSSATTGTFNPKAFYPYNNSTQPIDLETSWWYAGEVYLAIDQKLASNLKNLQARFSNLPDFQGSPVIVNNLQDNFFLQTQVVGTYSKSHDKAKIRISHYNSDSTSYSKDVYQPSYIFTKLWQDCISDISKDNVWLADGLDGMPLSVKTPISIMVNILDSRENLTSGTVCAQSDIQKYLSGILAVVQANTPPPSDSDTLPVADAMNTVFSHLIGGSSGTTAATSLTNIMNKVYSLGMPDITQTTVAGKQFSLIAQAQSMGIDMITSVTDSLKSIFHHFKKEYSDFRTKILHYAIAGSAATGIISIFSGGAASATATVMQMWIQYETLVKIAQLSMALAWLPIVLVVLTSLFSAGITFAVLMPITPYVLFWAGIIAWLLSVIEAMIAAPLLALGMAFPGGHDMMGHVVPGVRMLLGTIFRPVLMVLGMLIAMVLTYIVIYFSAQGFHMVAANILAMIPSVADHQTAKGIVACVMLFVYCSFLALAFNKCFSTIYVIPEKVMQWVGGSADKAGPEELQQISQTVSSTSQQAGQAGGQGVQAGISAQQQETQATSSMAGGMVGGAEKTSQQFKKDAKDEEASQASKTSGGDLMG